MQAMASKVWILFIAMGFMIVVADFMTASSIRQCQQSTSSRQR